MSNDMLTVQRVIFDESTHTYDDGRLPSVTEVCRILHNSNHYTEEARTRGKAVHMACHFLDDGDLDLDSLAPEIAGYVAAYQKVMDDTGFKWVAIETPMCDLRRTYAGTPDRISRWEVVDLKTGAFEDWHPIQLVGYNNMLPNPWSYRRLAVYLSEDGTYSLREFPKTDYARDLAVFQSALNITNWKRGFNGR